jgi:hypothetical protein
MAKTLRTRNEQGAAAGQLLISLLVVVFLVGVLGGFLWIIFRGLDALDSDVATAAIGAAATILVSVIAVFFGRYLERRRELEMSAREKRIPIYESFVDVWFRQLYWERMGEEEPSKEEVMKAMVDFTKDGTVWASDEVILKWSEVRRRFALLGDLQEELTKVGTEPQGAAAVEPLFIFEEFLLSIRKDTGYAKTKLKRGDLLGMFIDDIDQYLQTLEEVQQTSAAAKTEE